MESVPCTKIIMPIHPYTQTWAIIIPLNIFLLDAILIALESHKPEMCHYHNPFCQKCAILIALMCRLLDAISIAPMTQANPNENSCRYILLVDFISIAQRIPSLSCSIVPLIARGYVSFSRVSSKRCNLNRK